MAPRRSYSFVEKSSRYTVEVSRGHDKRRFAVSRLTLFGGAGAFALALLAVVGAAGYLMFRDEMLANLLERQAQMQYAYEDRLAAARLRLDQVTSKQFVDQDGVEGKVQSLVMRQAMLETRAAVVAQLVERTVRGAESAPGGLDATPTGALSRALASKPTPALDETALPYAAKPQPEGMDLRLGPAVTPVTGATRAEPPKPTNNRKNQDRSAYEPTALPRVIRPTSMLADAADSGLPMQTRLASLASSLDRVERDQATRVEGIVKPALAAAGRLRRAFDEAGLPVERYVTKPKAARTAVGGPFVPADLKASGAAFDRELVMAQNAVATLDGLRRALPSVPLRKPFSGELQITSNFGYRTDPFLGRPALHAGVDMREEYGKAVHVTAAGTVIAAGPAGGYGNMVEVDHGGGLSTRYGHLSAIDVSVGQQVVVGAIIGRVGSTGRSTGPHLHYEVRTDGEAVDPSRFLRAASVLNGYGQ